MLYNKVIVLRLVGDGECLPVCLNHVYVHVNLIHVPLLPQKLISHVNSLGDSQTECRSSSRRPSEPQTHKLYDLIPRRASQFDLKLTR